MNEFAFKVISPTSTNRYKIGTGTWGKFASTGKETILTNNHVVGDKPGSVVKVEATAPDGQKFTANASVVKAEGSKEKDIVALKVEPKFHEALKKYKQPPTINDLKNNISPQSLNAQIANIRLGANFGGNRLNEGSAVSDAQKLPNGDVKYSLQNPSGQTGKEGNSGGPVLKRNAKGESVDAIVKARPVNGERSVITSSFNDPETVNLANRLAKAAA